MLVGVDLGVVSREERWGRGGRGGMRGYQEGYMHAVRRRALQKGFRVEKGVKNVCGGEGGK